MESELLEFEFFAILKLHGGNDLVWHMYGTQISIPYQASIRHRYLRGKLCHLGIFGALRN